MFIFQELFYTDSGAFCFDDIYRGKLFIFIIIGIIVVGRAFLRFLLGCDGGGEGDDFGGTVNISDSCPLDEHCGVIIHNAAVFFGHYGSEHGIYKFHNAVGAAEIPVKIYPCTVAAAVIGIVDAFSDICKENCGVGAAETVY